MWEYHWYLFNKTDLPEKFNKEPGEWILICLDFPDLFISDASLLGKNSAMDNWGTNFMRERAQIATEKIIEKMMAIGDTLPSPKEELTGYFSFTVRIAPMRMDGQK